MNLNTLDQIFIPLPSNRLSTRGFRSRLYLVSFFQLYRWKANIFSTQREKGRLSYSQLDPFFSAGQSQSKYIHNSLSNVSHLPAVDQGIEG